MRLKVFQSKTMVDAITLIRHELGDDAIIVGNETTADGVRITAASESSRPSIVNEQMAIPEVADTLYDLFEYHRVPLPIAEKLIGMALMLDTHDPVLALGSAFDTAFSFQPLHLADPSRCILLIGPAGQGKTVTTARLAARSVLPQRPVRVIAADTVRAGAFAQIDELCRPMGLTPLVWAPPMINEVDSNFTIIDGPGINPFDVADRTEIGKLITETGAEPILVMAAGGDPEEAAQVGEAFFSLGVRRFIATRIDATRRLGSILTTAAAGLALADGGIGRTLVDTLMPMNPLALARLLAAARSGSNAFDSFNCEEAA